MTGVRDSSKPGVAAFDFDGTITQRDTFVPFLLLAFGPSKLALAFLVLSLEAVKVGLGTSDRDRFKSLLIARLFRGKSRQALCEAGELHAKQIMQWLRPKALSRISWHRHRGDRLVLVSASMDFYLEPVARQLGFDDLLCTRASGDKLVFDGGVLGRNCRGPEKVARLKDLLGALDAFELYAYGDSDGDKEMLEAANHSFYRAFAPGVSLF